MGKRTTLKEGNVESYSTRPVGLNTALFLEAGAHDAEAIWHIELCCKEDNVINLEPGEQRKLNISEAAGAMVSVRNSGWSDFSCWTDY